MNQDTLRIYTVRAGPIRKAQGVPTGGRILSLIQLVYVCQVATKHGTCPTMPQSMGDVFSRLFVSLLRVDVRRSREVHTRSREEGGGTASFDMLLTTPRHAYPRTRKGTLPKLPNSNSASRKYHVNQQNSFPGLFYLKKGLRIKCVHST